MYAYTAVRTQRIRTYPVTLVRGGGHSQVAVTDNIQPCARRHVNRTAHHAFANYFQRKPASPADDYASIIILTGKLSIHQFQPTVKTVFYAQCQC